MSYKPVQPQNCTVLNGACQAYILLCSLNHGQFCHLSSIRWATGRWLITWQIISRTACSSCPGLANFAAESRKALSIAVYAELRHQNEPGNDLWHGNSMYKAL